MAPAGDSRQLQREATSPRHPQLIEVPLKRWFLERGPIPLTQPILDPGVPSFEEDFRDVCTEHVLHICNDYSDSYYETASRSSKSFEALEITVNTILNPALSRVISVLFYVSRCSSLRTLRPWCSKRRRRAARTASLRLL